MSKIVVIGANGFVGLHIVNSLIEKGYSVEACASLYYLD